MFFFKLEKNIGQNIERCCMTFFWGGEFITFWTRFFFFGGAVGVKINVKILKICLKIVGPGPICL